MLKLFLLTFLLQSIISNESSAFCYFKTKIRGLFYLCYFKQFFSVLCRVFCTLKQGCFFNLKGKADFIENYFKFTLSANE